MPIYQTTATLFYTPKTSIVTINPVTGQPEVQDSGIEESITVSIEQRETQAKVFSLGGKDIAGTYITGRLLPIGSTFPSWYVPNAECRIELTNGTVGKFYVYLKTPSRFGLEKIFGDRVTGILTDIVYP